ncbi:alpha/beta fold hydrolase [Legionella sainthelensi]|uniref:alpha/beta fold hydrolase n=1 Tax=Legionella sainthelensi TaxID=28087 RepID=UPI0021657D69|nr:alpha/beta hydrolase [Legionella sainthelensi]
MAKSLSPNASEEIKAYLYHILTQQKPTSLASALRGMALREMTSHVLATTTVPVLIITGEFDKIISPQQSVTMHALSKNSQLVILADAGHLSNFEQPNLWNQSVIDMFAY